MIGNTTIHGKPLLGLLALWFKLSTPRPAAMAITVWRDPSKDPNALLFGLTTNKNGTETTFDGTFEQLDAGGNVTYTVEFKKGSAQSYKTIVSDDRNKPAIEEVVIVAPKFTIKAGGKVAEFDSREFNRRPGGQ